MEKHRRKQNRLQEYCYSGPNAYFLTICTDNRKNLFWNDVGAAIGRLEDVRLSGYGKIVEQAILNISIHYPAVSVDRYVIMPNHVHLLAQIHADADGRPLAAPTISTIINQMKGAVSRKVGFTVWQKGFYDHVVRGDADYREIWLYIEGNPVRWLENNKTRKGDHRLSDTN